MDICSNYGLSEPDAIVFSQYYHDLGYILHFHEHQMLREIIFLKPSYATEAVYKITDDNEVIEANGQFSFSQLNRIWKNYPKDKFVYLLELMKKFELCFELSKNRTYIVPELLPSETPDFEWNFRGNLNFYYLYEFMPEGIMTRFIVRCHDLISGNFYWKNGVVLSIKTHLKKRNEFKKTKALINLNRYDKTIKCWIDGYDKVYLLSIIRREIEYINKTLNYPEVKEMIPCKCNECIESDKPHYFSYQLINKYIQKNREEITCVSRPIENEIGQK